MGTLTLYYIKNKDRVFLLDAPLAPLGLFGNAVKSIFDRIQKARRQAGAFQRFLPHRPLAHAAAEREQPQPHPSSSYREAQRQSIANRAPPSWDRGCRPTCCNLENYITLDGCSVNSFSSVRNLGVVFDRNLLFESHISSICKTAFFHLKNTFKLQPMLSTSNAEMLIHAFMISRLDYCNALLGGCSVRLIKKLQMVQNAAARVLTRTRTYDHITPVLATLHWLPIKHRIDFKILLITYKALNGFAPQYLTIM